MTSKKTLFLSVGLSLSLKIIREKPNLNETRPTLIKLDLSRKKPLNLIIHNTDSTPPELKRINCLLTGPLFTESTGLLPAEGLRL